MVTIFWILFFITFPILIMYGCYKSKILDSIGAVVLCYGTGIIIGNIGVLPEPEGFLKVQNTFLTATVPIALPLLFFSIDMKKWMRLAGKALISTVGAVIAVLISTTVAILVFQSQVENAWKVSGMLIGCYTGGTPNMASIGTALRVEASQYVAVHAADVVLGAIYLLIAITVLPKILGFILPKFKKSEEDIIEGVDTAKFETNFAGFNKKNVLPLGIAFLLAIVIFGIGGGLTFLVPESIKMVVAILTITTLGVGASFILKIRKIEYTFQLGYFIILVFSLVVSSMADIGRLITAAPVIVAYVAIAVFLAAIIHVFMSFIGKVDVDTHIITSVAFVLSPPFVPMVAAALKNKEIVITGVLTGIFGWVIGNYLGISYAYVLRNFLY